MDSAIHGFSEETEAWFRQSLGTPTKVQREAWPAIAKGYDTLVSAPTGTGKTLTAFLVFLDRFKNQIRNGTLKEIQLHSLLMMEGDINAGEVEAPVEWITFLLHQGLIDYIEPGLWIAAGKKRNMRRHLWNMTSRALINLFFVCFDIEVDRR